MSGPVSGPVSKSVSRPMNGQVMTMEAVRAALNVSRETFDKLTAYVALLEKWQPRINLIANSTVTDIWHRHVLDSAQLVSHIPAGTKTILDVGSGGGFPGLVLAIMTDATVHLVESDQRKSIFLQTVIRELQLTAVVHNHRLESLPPMAPDLITARALASVEKLLILLESQLASGPDCLFLKGAKVDEELTILTGYPNITASKFQSASSSDGVVLKLTFDENA